jgi:hypothetical protein
MLRAEGELSPQELKKGNYQKIQGWYVPPPARPGVSYMLSPIQRLYGGLESRETRAVVVAQPEMEKRRSPLV